MLNSIMIFCKESDFAGSGVTTIILMLSVIIAAVISVLIIFYTNSFLIKRRKKELGLYSVLGMEKRHVARVLFWEVTITGILSLATGIIGGMIFDKLMFLVMINLLKMPSDIRFFIPGDAIFTTLALFTATFLVVMVYNFTAIHLTNPITLLHAGSHGEREPKSKRLMTVLGVLSLGAGYILALSVKTPSEAVSAFFFAVSLVIAGTYLLFTSGSIMLLKALRKNKTFYYNPKNFISVSGMIYRMKQNAIGLANICILSTCVLVTLSSTVSLYIGEEDILHTRFSKDVLINANMGENVEATLQNTLEKLAKEKNVSMEDVNDYYDFSFPAILEGNKILTKEEMEQTSSNQYYVVDIIPIDSMELDIDNQLSENQVMLFSFQDHNMIQEESSIILKEKTFEVTQILDRENFDTYSADISLMQQLVILVKDYEALTNMRKLIYPPDWERNQITYSYNFNLQGEEDAKLDFVNAIPARVQAELPGKVYAENIFTSRQDFYALYGSLMFIGIFFVVLFLIATVLIIYYKQISEGFDDHDRFQIMQDVGLSQQEVKQMIWRQVMLVFFLPLAVAVVHIGVAFPVLCKLLTVFNMTNMGLFLGCTIVTIVVFSLFYLAVYRCTARTYYHLVQDKEPC